MMPLEPNPAPPVGQPPTAAPVDATSILPLPEDGPNTLTAWLRRAKASEQEQQKTIDKAKENIQAYNGKTLDKLPTQDTIVVNKDFSNVERKKPELFGQVPAIQLTAELPGLDGAVQVFQSVVNKYLGAKGVNANAMMDECLPDVLFAGLAASKLGHEAFQDGTKQVPSGRMIPDPNAPPPPPVQAASGQPPMPPPAPPMIPEMVNVPNLVYAKYYWNRMSPAKFRSPVEFTGSDFDQAAWLCQEFTEDYELGKVKYNLPVDFAKTSAVDDDKLVTPSTQTGDGSKEIIKGYEFWYKAHLFDPTEKHPLKIRQLVIIDGYDQPVVHRDSPYQDINPTTGEVIGMVGFPIHVLTLRYVSDQAFPPADCTVSRATVNELGKGRTQMIQQRKRSLPMRWANLEAIGGQATLDKIENGEMQSIIPVQGDGNQMMGQIATATFPRENFTFNDYCDRDISELWAFGENQRGLDTQTAKTATELSIVQQSTNVVMAKQRGRVLNYFVSGAEKLGALIQMFATDSDYIALEGQQGSAALQAWNKQTIAGRFAYSAKPDSTIAIDASQDKQNALKEYQMIANDPFCDPMEVRRECFTRLGYDVGKLLRPPQPKPPELPKINYSFVGADLDPQSPQFPIVMEILRIGGVQISPDAVQSARQHAVVNASLGIGPGAAKDSGKTPPNLQGPQTQHPGSTSQVEPINKHVFDQTGARSGPVLPPQSVGVQ